MLNTLDSETTDRLYEENPSAKKILLIASCLGATTGPISLTSVTLALPTIALDFSADAQTLSWIAISFILSSAICMLPASKLADIYGRKRFVMIGVLGSAVISVLCSLVQSAEGLIVLRFLQGFFTAIVFAPGMAILVSVFSDKNRGSAIGMYSGSVYVALSIAPFLGGLITEYISWRAVFWLQLPISAIVFVLFWFKIPGEWRQAESQRFDWAGSTIFGFWAATFVFGLSGLPDKVSIVTLAISFAYLGLFVWHQNRIDNPIIPISLLTKNRVVAFSLIASVLMYSVNYPMGFLLSLFLQFAEGLSPTNAGFILLVQAAVMALTAPIAGRLSDRFDSGVVATLGIAFFILGLLTIFVVANIASTGFIALGLMFLGIGFGFFSTPNNSAIMGAVAKRDLGATSATVHLARTIGNLVGISMMALVIYAMIGDQEFSFELTKELNTTLDIWLVISVVLTFIAALLCFFRRSTKSVQEQSEPPEIKSPTYD